MEPPFADSVGYVHSENNTPRSFAVRAVAGKGVDSGRKEFESRLIQLLAPFRVVKNQGKHVCRYVSQEFLANSLKLV